MTFYHVLSALLFVGAFRELLTGIENDTLSLLLIALTLSLMVFNDAIYSSWAVEIKGVSYGTPLMIIDLLNFSLLATVLISINPTHKSVFDIEVPKIGSWITTSTAWFILCGYWVLIMVWTYIAGIYSKSDYPKWLIGFAALISVAFFIQGWLYRQPDDQCQLCKMLCTAYPFLYILLIRPITFYCVGPPKQEITLKELSHKVEALSELVKSAKISQS